jgi:hypothetical protein
MGNLQDQIKNFALFVTNRTKDYKRLFGTVPVAVELLEAGWEAGAPSFYFWEELVRSLRGSIGFQNK